MINVCGVYHHDADGATAECTGLFGSPLSPIIGGLALFLGPETRGKVMTADLEVIKVEVPT